MLAGGCEIHQVTPPPASLREYEQAQAASTHPYPDRTIVLHNVRRVLDPQLGESERVESLGVVARLGQGNAEVQDQIATLLTDDSCPEALRSGVADILLKSDHPGAAAHVLKTLPALRTDSPMKQHLLDWLSRHPTPAVLAEVVKLWGQEESTTSIDEPRYRQVVERLTGKAWDQALLDALNTRGFRARGSAMAVLSARRPRADLVRRIGALSAKTDAVAVMQYYLQVFDYLPTSGRSMLQCVWVYAKDPSGFDGASKLASAWRTSYDYRFDVRDFHLVSRLSRDPLRKNHQRSELILRLARSLLKRRHVRRKVAQPVGLYDFSDQFGKHVESLTMADLWNLVLLDEMLARPRVRSALQVVCERDRADTRSAWGGLVFYEAGQAEAKLYPPSYDYAPSDQTYRPTLQATQDGRVALCRFHGHFEKVDNTDRAGPTAEELQAIRQENVYGLVLTRLAEGAFCAHYYNPKGIVISLGSFPFP